jgi:hypothetical protein
MTLNKLLLAGIVCITCCTAFAQDIADRPGLLKVLTGGTTRVWTIDNDLVMDDSVACAHGTIEFRSDSTWAMRGCAGKPAERNGHFSVAGGRLSLLPEVFSVTARDDYHANDPLKTHGINLITAAAGGIAGKIQGIHRLKLSLKSGPQ